MPRSVSLICSRIVFVAFLGAGTAVPSRGENVPQPETTPAASVPTDTTAPAEPRTEQPRGILGEGLLVGPKLTAFGAPTLFRVGLEGRWQGRWGFSFDYGFTPQITVDRYSGKATSWLATARFYPWKGAFFVGLGAGKQGVNASSTVAFPGETVTVTTQNDAFLLVPQVGWRWVWDSGFYFGVELGVQVVLNSETQSSSDASFVAQQSPTYATVLGQINRDVNDFAKNPLPQLALLQIGYFF